VQLAHHPALLLQPQLLIFSSCSAFAESYGPQHDAIETLFKSNSEKTTKDAVWTSNRIFKVGVLNNGSNRDGYADYVCQVMYEYDFKGKSIWVQVIDIAQLVKAESTPIFYTTHSYI